MVRKIFNLLTRVDEETIRTYFLGIIRCNPFRCYILVVLIIDSMIIEIAILDIKSRMSNGFEQVFSKASQIIYTLPESRSHD